jgi:D-serine dehydratase
MLKRVYLAPDELTAITLREMLKSVDITAVIQRFETTWLDGLPRVMKGGWGEVLVDEQDVEDAEQHIQRFMEESERS